MDYNECSSNEINPFQKIAIVQDGAGQIQAIENTLLSYCDENHLQIIWGKYAAGASPTQSRNNKGTLCHPLQKQYKSSDLEKN